MTKWQQLKLGEIATFVNGYAFKPSDWNDTGIPIIRIQNLTNDNASRNYYNGQLDEKYRVVRGDILISWSATIGVFEWTREDSYLNQHIFKVVFNKLKVNKSFFKYLIKQKINEMLAKVHGSTMKHITKSNFDNIPILLPDIKEQDRIARILDKAEEIRTKKKLANEKLDEFLKSTFIDMFGDPVTNPNNYQFVCLGDLTTEICDIGSNGSNAVVAKNLKMSDTEDYAYMIRAVNFSDNNIFENMKYVSKEVYDFFRKSQIFGNEIIMCKIGSAGKFWLMPKLNKPTSLGLNSFLMRFNDNTNRIFIYHYLNTSYGQIEINTRVSGAVTKSITKGAIRTIPVYLPDIEQQNQFAKIVQKVDTQKEKNQKVIEHMDNLFNSLMQQAFKGKI